MQAALPKSGARGRSLFLAGGLVGAASLRLYPSPSEGALRPNRSRDRFLENGAIAQLGERFNGIEEVVGSIPSGSTKSSAWKLLNVIRRLVRRHGQSLSR
jgi:hypothetical protein